MRNFNQLLHYERARADRSQHEFSLLIFRLDKRGRGPAVPSTATHELRSSLTELDEVGWIDRNRLGVILPCVGKSAAQRLALEMTKRLADRALKAHCRVFSYPSAVGQLARPKSVSFSASDDDLDERNSARSKKWLEPHVAGSSQSPDGLARKPTALPVAPPRNIELPPPEINDYLFQQAPFWKRTLDIAVSIASLLLFPPLFLVLVIYIRMVSPGPIFFQQRRVGGGGRPFTIWKYRTMETGVDADRHRHHIAGAMRHGTSLEKLDDELALIHGGGLIRSLGIDELPQLFNVLRGEMSIVGPRPDVISIWDYEPWQRRRFDVLPGITGLWQVSGKNQTTFEEMMRLDGIYARCCSLGLDLKILWRTFPAVVREFVA